MFENGVSFHRQLHMMV